MRELCECEKPEKTKGEQERRTRYESDYKKTP